MKISKNELIEKIVIYYKANNKVPTINSFSIENNLHASTIIRKFGSWNGLLKSAGLKPNKASKRSKDQLISWLKIHPNTKYSDIPYGIRSALEENFETVSNARSEASLPITDWRSVYRPRKGSDKAGRPIEYKKEDIIAGLRKLATTLGRPPRMKDISKKACGFPISALLLRFGTFNNALNEASLPPAYSYQEENKMLEELKIILLNIKFQLQDYPIFYNIEVDNIKPTFVYKDRLEFVVITRSSIETTMEKFNHYNSIVWFLVDDSLREFNNISIKSIMDFRNNIGGMLLNKLLELRTKYDEISRKYIGQELGQDA